MDFCMGKDGHRIVDESYTKVRQSIDAHKRAIELVLYEVVGRENVQDITEY